MRTRRAVTCPRCRSSDIDTVTTAPYIRGFVLAYNYGTKRFVGCNPCVKKQLAGEVGLSLLTGWFSVTSLLVNPMCILWNTARLPFVKANPEQVEQLMRELGIDTHHVDLARIAASLAATMVAADGKVEPQEVQAAVQIGTQLFQEFDAKLFNEVLENVKRLPSTTELAAMLTGVLDEPGRAALIEFLHAIASSDGNIDAAEIKELQEAANALGVALPDAVSLKTRSRE